MLTSENHDLVLKYLPFADSIAKNQFKKTPPQVELDELKSAAYLGLVDAASRYDGKTDFKVFASYRISGEIKDYLRSLQWDRHNNKVASLPEDYDIAAEEEADNFDEVFDDVTRNRLSMFAKNIMRMYYGERLTIVQIAEKVKLSGARVSQILKLNVETLKSALCA